MEPWEVSGARTSIYRGAGAGPGSVS